MRSESAGSLLGEQKSSSPPPPLPTVLSSPGLAPSAHSWEWAEMQLLLEQEMTAVFPIVELMLGVEAWLFLMRREAVEEEEMRIAMAAAEAQANQSSTRKWSLFSNDTIAAATPSAKQSVSRKSSAAALPSSAFSVMRESEQLSLMSVLLRVVQCCSSSTALFALLFASTRADELTGILHETFDSNAASLTTVSIVLARYSTPGRVRLNAAGRWSQSPKSSTHRRSSSAAPSSFAALLPVSAAPLSSVGSIPSSPTKSKRLPQSDVSSSLCTLVYTLATHLPLWDQLDCSPVFSAFLSPAPSTASSSTDKARSPSRPAPLRFPPASPPELSSLRYLNGEDDSPLPTRSLSSPSALVLPMPPHPLQEQNGYVVGGCRVSLLSVSSLLTALLQLMRDRCPTATFLIASPATLHPSGSEGALAPSPSPQPSSGALSATSSSGPSPPSTPVRSSPSSQQSSVSRASKRRDSLTNEEERIKEHRRIKEIGRNFGLEAASHSILSSSPPPSSSQATTSSLRPFSPAQLRSSPFSSFLAGKGSPSRSSTPSAARSKPASLRVMTDNSGAHPLSYSPVTFTLPGELSLLLTTLPTSRLTEAQCATLVSFLLHSPAWTKSAQPLKCIAAHFVQSEAAEVRRRMDSFTRAAAYLLDCHSTVQQNEAQQYNITAMYVEAVRTQHTQIEMERRQLVRRRADKKRRGEQQTWRLILRQLTNERGAWE